MRLTHDGNAGFALVFYAIVYKSMLNAAVYRCIHLPVGLAGLFSPAFF